MATNKDVIIKTLDVCKWIFILWVVYEIVTFGAMITGNAPISSSTIIDDVLFGNSGVTILE